MLSPLPLIALILEGFAPLATGVGYFSQPQEPGKEVVEYRLLIEETQLSPAGRTRKALTVNGSIPAPVLRFREGDQARILVRNALENEESSIHWHGLLVPNAMDGVPFLTTPPIPPGGERWYEFPLRQAGTYWYHSHTALQEQRGVYGAIVIEPRSADLAFDREHVVVLSDWTDESPHEVMRTLMRGSEWYGIRKGNVQSLFGAWQAGALDEYLDREKSRMPPMDVSDVAYDAFLANGQQKIQLDAEAGERVLLRFVNAGASTYFHLTSSAGPLTLVGADGPRVKPVEVKRLLIGMAETYDVLVTMPAENVEVEILASAQDGTGSASIILGEGELLPAKAPPKPDLYRMDEMLMAGLESLDHARGQKAADAERPFAPYALLSSTQPTTIPAAQDEHNVRTLTMRLTGDMERYLWGFDGKSLSETSVIPVRKGEVLRIELNNDTMMHHPIHLHGHFFRLLNGKGDLAPLKHTVDVPPMGTRVIEWIADEEKADWFFHCHMLYHMDAGMARVFSYQDQEPDHQVSLDPNLVNPVFFFAEGSILSSATMGMVMAMQGKNDYVATWHSGYGVHHNREADLFWSRYFSPNFSTILGYRIDEQMGSKDRAFAGLQYRLPYFLHSDLSVDSKGDARLKLQKELQLTDRFSLSGSLEYDTNSGEEWGLGGHWVLSKDYGFAVQHHSEHGFGAGFSFQF